MWDKLRLIVTVLLLAVVVAGDGQRDFPPPRQLSRVTRESQPLPPDNEDAVYSVDYLHDVYYSGLRRATRQATTAECKRKIEIEYMRQLRVITEESPYPFENVFFHTQCPIIWEESKAETIQPLMPVLTREIPRPPPQSRYPLPPPKQPDARTLAIMYIMLVHNHADFAIRIINAVREPQHTFVVHIDIKSSPDTVQKLHAYAAENEHIHVLDDDKRLSINWGGFSMVNATLIGMHYAWDELFLRGGRHFDYLIDISGTSYPIKSNEEIRRALARGPPGAVYMDIQSDASRPMPEMWQQYVECDDALHRIARFPLLRGMNMHIGSQWFALPRHVVDWYLHNPLPREYIEYAKYVVVADENYFSTLFKNSPYCESHATGNLLFVLFDKWENERASHPSLADPRKCLHPDPSHCGRSPTTLTTEYRRLLQVSRFLFARKFDPDSPQSMQLCDDMDRWRGTAGTNSNSNSGSTSAAGGGGASASSGTGNDVSSSSNGGGGGASRRVAAGDEGKNIMLRYQPAPEKGKRVKTGRAVVCEEGMVCPDPGGTELGAGDGGEDDAADADDDDDADDADDDADDEDDYKEPDLCLELGKESEQVYLRECNSNKPQQWLTIGPCTEGSNVTFGDDHCAAAVDEQEDMFCILQGWKSERNLCLDISGEDAHGGSPLIAWDCSGQWNQLFRFLPDCSVSAVQPEFIGKVRGMEGRNVTLCVEPVLHPVRPGYDEDGEAGLEGTYVKVEPCGAVRHRFHALAEDGPEQLLYRWRQPDKESRKGKGRRRRRGRARRRE